MWVHGNLREEADLRMLQDSFNRNFDYGQKASPGADLSRVGAVALARGVETVDCTA